jgi:hypothetical protein
MIQINETYAAAADERLVGIKKPVVVSDVDDPCSRVSHRIEILFYPAMLCRGDDRSFVGCPGEPGLAGWIAAFEDEAAVFAQVIMGGSQDGDGIVVTL